MTPQLQVVVPTLGRSPVLAEVLAALAAERDTAGGPLDVVVVRQGAVEVPAGRHRELHLPDPVGFSAAVNRGIAAGEAPFVATVNDDAVVEPGWAASLLRVLGAEPGLAAVQGVNRQSEYPERADGWGLAWNRWLQAVQIGHGGPLPPADSAPREVFGVSATAAVYRRSALVAVARTGPTGGGEIFDERLGSYYEDVELAGRLRAAGFVARAVPAARARHAGATSLGGRRWRWVYGNRYRVAAQLLGRTFWWHLPRLLLRDGIDLGRFLLRADFASAAEVLAGGWRAARALPGHLRWGSPAVPLGELRRGLEEAP
ncbi:MAG: glycosyltransferase [Thermoanaerobaculia bacterium]|nr:glycosyltransferase [Thermoanaerobaculia bacterium]